ncbi:MAG: cobalamin biosynthesis protein [Methanosphaera stadtmanae]|nr:cobalamin biosynthesis protein [Methanosphaera stadtmanae]
MLTENLIYGISIFVLAVLIDMIIGEVPNKIHPVIYMGKLITKLKNYLPKTKFSGLLIVLTVSLTFFMITFIILFLTSYVNIYLYIILASIIFSTTFSIKLLIESVLDIKHDLEHDINKARKDVSYLVSRNTDTLSESRIVSAAIETLTENITDSVIAPLFYTAIIILLPYGMTLAIPIAMLYRCSNTMDAMLGYETDELKEIGYVPAKLDDILNYIPARISGVIVVISSLLHKYDYKQSWDVMRKFARKTPSPNSGYTMAATAGALDIILIKENVYQLGYGKSELTGNKIVDAVKITKTTSLIFIILVIMIYFILLIIFGG